MQLANRLQDFLGFWALVTGEAWSSGPVAGATPQLICQSVHYLSQINDKLFAVPLVSFLLEHFQWFVLVVGRLDGVPGTPRHVGFVRVGG